MGRVRTKFGEIIKQRGRIFQKLFLKIKKKRILIGESKKNTISSGRLGSKDGYILQQKSKTKWKKIIQCIQKVPPSVAFPGCTLHPALLVKL